MTGTFTGFPERALDFYEGLEADNSKAYWTDHKDVYDTCVAGPLKALVADLAPEFGEAKVFRPYRDVRFSKDKTAYKTHAAAVVQDPTTGRSVLYVQLSAAGLVVGSGYWHQAPDQLERWRAVVGADGPEVTALQTELDRLTGAGWRLGGETMKSGPRGWPRDHPRAALLRHKGIAVVREWGPEPFLHGSGCREVVAEAWRECRVLGEWLQRHVGASRLPADRHRR